MKPEPRTELERDYVRKQAEIHEQLRSELKPDEDDPFDEFDMLSIDFAYLGSAPGDR